MITFRFPPSVAKQHSLVTSFDLQNAQQPPHILLFLHLKLFFCQAFIIRIFQNALEQNQMSTEIPASLGKRPQLLPGTTAHRFSNLQKGMKRASISHVPKQVLICLSGLRSTSEIELASWKRQEYHTYGFVYSSVSNCINKIPELFPWWW